MNSTGFCNPGAGPSTHRAVQDERIRVYMHDGSSDLDTISNNPGTGRILDKAYQSAGRKLEEIIAKIVKRPIVSLEEDDDGDSEETSEQEAAFESEDLTEAEVEIHIRKPGSDDLTESDLIGPGRTLGKAYRYAGDKLERVLGNWADKAGFGPDASDRHIRSHFHAALIDGVFHKQNKKKFVRDVRRLLKYTQ